MSTYKQLFETLDETLHSIFKEIDAQKLENMATDEWTVNDVLCHIAFWHNYYADQYNALANGEKPFVVTSRGGSTRNQDGVNFLKDKSKKELLEMINKSQLRLYESIVIKEVPGMDYTDRRHYTTSEFLDIVTQHIKRHSIQVHKAKEI